MNPKTLQMFPSLLRRPFLHLWIFLGLLTAFSSACVFACDFCVQLPNAPIDFNHPAAIEVAMATQAAAKLGEINLNPWVTIHGTSDRNRKMPLADVSSRKLVASWIGTRPAKDNVMLRCTIELIFVDVDETCWLDVRLGEILGGDPRLGPADVQLITTKAGFLQMLEAGFESCEERQLIAVESLTTMERTGLMRLFAARTKADPATVATTQDARSRATTSANALNE